jgi:hypothetical protein
MLGSVGSIVPKRWILGIFALGLIATMVATSANPWAGAATLPTTVSAQVLSASSIKVTWVAVDAGSTVPGGSPLVDGYSVSCLGSPGTVTKTVTGISATTVTVDNLTANTAYVCSVLASSGSTLPSSGIAASSVTTTAALLTGVTILGGDNRSIASDATVPIDISTAGADSGFTIAVSVDTGGSVNAASGTESTSFTFTSSGTGTSVVTVTVTQTSTGWVKSDTVTFAKIGAAPADEVEEPVAPTTAEQSSLPDISDKPAGSAAAGVFDATSGATIFAVTPPQPTEGTPPNEPVAVTVNFPSGAFPNSAGSVSVEVFSSSPTEVEDYVDIVVSGGTGASAPVITPIKNAGSITIDIKNNAGEDADVTTTDDVAVKFKVDQSIFNGSVDFESVAMFKTDNPLTGPWTELATGFTIVGGEVEFEAKTRNFSTFMLGSKTRDIGIGGSGAVLPSAGDAAPTTTQALLLAGLGLMLIAGGGVYVRRQRRATAVD